jgi:glc operon protein GlcG
MLANLLRPLSVLAGVAIAVPGVGAQDPAKPLVTRNQVRINLKGAEVILAAAREKATEMKLAVNIAVVDDGGHLVAFARMDGARPGSATTAQTKATAAATFRQATGPLPVKGEPDLLLSLGLPMAAAASGGKATSLAGGVPIVVDGQVIGAVGVGGGTGEQDAEVARAGIQALIKAIEVESKPGPSK